MKEYVLQEPKVVTAEEREPGQPGRKEALIRIRHVGICGSDIHLFNGTYNGPHRYPMLFGHEWSGVVEAVGEDVTKVKPGDLVTGDCSRYCGKCPQCGKDRNLCSHIEKFGITIDGATAEYITRDETYLYKGPEGVDESLLALSEPVAVAAHLLAKVQTISPEPLSEKKVLVLGGGVIGMAAAMLLKTKYGCADISLYDLAKHRTDIASSFGCSVPTAESLAPKEDDGSYEALYAAAQYDIVIESTGVASVFANALNLIKPAGILGCVGMIAEVPIAQKLIVTKSLTIIGSIGGTGDFDTAMEFLTNEPELADKLISHHFPMDQPMEAFIQARKPDESMKIVFDL